MLKSKFLRNSYEGYLRLTKKKDQKRKKKSSYKKKKEALSVIVNDQNSKSNASTAPFSKNNIN